MGDAVVRVQKHLQELSRDNFTALETTHGRNIDWLRGELIALCKEIDVAIKLELKRPAPATYTSEYVFVAKKQKVASPTVSRTQQQEEVSAASQPAPESIPSADPTESADANTNPQVVAIDNAEPVRAVETMKVKKFVTRIRKVMRPKRSSSVTKKRVKKEQRKLIDPESMKVVQLRAELKKRGLKAAGLKAVLVERLLEAIEEEDNSDDDDVVELEEVDEEYEEEIEEEVDVQSNNAAAASTTERSLRQKAAPATEESSSILDNELHSSPPSRSKSAKSDEIVRESDCGIDDVGLSQKSAVDESLLQAQANAKPKRTLQRGAGRKRPRNDVISESVDLDNNSDTESTEGDDSLVAEDGDVEMTSASSEPSLESKQPRRDVQESSSAEPAAITISHKANANTTDSITGETDTSDMSVNLRGKQSAQPPELELLEKKSSMKVSFAARKDDMIVPDSQPDQSLRASPSRSSSDDSVSRFRSISLPQPSVSTNATPTTPNGQMITDELQVARSEPTLGGPNDTDEDRRQREHQQTIEREAQRLRIAAKLSAKKRFEEAKLSSAFWAKRDRLKSQLQVAPSSSFDDAPSAKSAQVAGMSKPAEPQEKVTMKAEPELAVQATRQPSPQTAATEVISLAPEPLSTSSLVQQSTASSASTEVSLKLEPASQTRTKIVKIPFSSSNRRFSDPSRRLSASRRRESASGRRDSTSSRRDSVSSRRDSLSRRRDSGSSTVSSVSAKSGAEKAKAPANGSRKPTNLVSGLHSFTTLMEKENTSTASSSTRSAPVVNALKLAEKTRLLEQKKNLEKMKRKEALMKKYEEQRKLDDDKKKKTMGLKEKTERDAKLKREQDKMNEKKQREIELAKKRHQKLQEMRAGLEKKRAMLAAEKQAGAAKLAAQAASSNRRISTSSLSSQTSSKSAAPLQQAKSVAASQVLKATATSSQAVNASAAPKTTKPVVLPQVQKPALTSVQAPSSQAASAPVKKEATTSKAKDRPTDASTYDMSDNGESESDGDDSEDEDKHNKKNIPRWARKENLERILRVQFGPNASDPSPGIFPDFVDTCDLEAIFQPTDVRKKKRFAKRSSSGNWFGDRPTAREKALYKRDMGYLG